MKITTKDTTGTSFYDTTIRMTLAEMVMLLGDPLYQNRDLSDKVLNEWEFETDAGYVFTIYDWKERRLYNDDEPIEWHIGGMSRAITEQAKTEILALAGDK